MCRTSSAMCLNMKAHSVRSVFGSAINPTLWLQRKLCFWSIFNSNFISVWAWPSKQHVREGEMHFNRELTNMAPGQEVFALENHCCLNKVLEKNILKLYLKLELLFFFPEREQIILDNPCRIWSLRVCPHLNVHLGGGVRFEDSSGHSHSWSTCLYLGYTGYWFLSGFHFKF